MALPRVLVLVLAGGAGSRLELLTHSRAKPAVPYAGHYRLVDVVLTNCHHSGLSEVWLTQQTNPVSLTDHLNGGRPWDLDRTRGGLLVLAPRQDKDTGKGGFASGTADVLWRHTELIRDFDPEALVVVSADAVYALDYEEVVRGHLAELVGWAAEGVRGEVTLVLEGAPEQLVELSPAELVRQVAVREAAGLTRKEALAAVAAETGLPKRDVYDAVVAAKTSPSGR